MKKPPMLLLDSGAFSEWNAKGKGKEPQKEINLDEYIEFCLDHIDVVDYIANLDVIPGTPGDKNPSTEERERAAREGWENYERMIAGGIPPEKLIRSRLQTPI